jgi:predicted metal-binding membrane protein
MGALGPFLGMWTVMMAAMMLPSAMPMVRLHHLRADDAGSLRAQLRSGVFVSIYLLVWALVGLGVFVLTPIAGALVPAGRRPLAIASILLLTGLYQLTPLKLACLRVCRSPVDFLLTHWYRGMPGELRLGLEHAFYCLGCCWALMALFVTAGAMGLTWALIIAGIVFVEKVMPHGIAFGRTIGVTLIIGSIAVAARPELGHLVGIDI